VDKGNSNMRKRFYITIVLLAICAFSYIQGSNKVLLKENISYINITNNCTEVIYGIHYEIKYKEQLSVGSIMNANGTRIKAGEVLTSCPNQVNQQ
jgi:hypothetical protein